MTAHQTPGCTVAGIGRQGPIFYGGRQGPIFYGGRQGPIFYGGRLGPFFYGGRQGGKLELNLQRLDFYSQQTSVNYTLARN